MNTDDNEDKFHPIEMALRYSVHQSEIVKLLVEKKKAKAEEKKALVDAAPNMKDLLERICNAATPESQAVAITEAKEFLKKF